MPSLVVNGAPRTVEVEGDTPLLWVLREQLGLRGTKFGCGAALCGACTVHLDGRAVRSCVVPIAEVEGRSVVTIEGLPRAERAHIGAALGDALHPLQEAWIAENVPQCGYCQTGQIMAAAALLRAVPDPDDADIDAAMSANLCRCGTYERIRRAIKRAASALRGGAARP